MTEGTLPPRWARWPWRAAVEHGKHHKDGNPEKSTTGELYHSLPDRVAFVPRKPSKHRRKGCKTAAVLIVASYSVAASAGYLAGWLT